MVNQSRYLLTLMFALFSVVAFGQNFKPDDERINKSGVGKLIFVTPGNAGCEAGEALAKKDIADDIPFLCLAGGIAPMAFMPTDSLFEQKYNVHYYEFGCSPADNTCMMSYNAKVFAHLQKLHGIYWWKTVRKDVIGFKEWKKSAKL
ncbi:hypothetical protein ACFP2F_12625 [Hymenobacter artigasi]|uniref:Uncharacterized protein n=1 Tax=Hymenobacter artigasi TaxID=2719616 RepID=A0ABX1HDE0_9BACT|nr:hypothetical protein [Hymenobacter artigasi]NKI88239.1 hypothetical protein [Hymenobacter artigasi]